jgi:aconitate hydratase
MGATNAYSGEIGTGLNVLTGEKGQAFSKTGRYYKARALRWVIVGDHNYGEGSSREHAALSPRLLGGAAVIARSFARIHESNLKKQGLLALTFQNPEDYARIGENDRIDIVRLAALAPGRPVECLIRHPGGTTETLSLSHSFSAAQLEWFKAGSALNLVRPRE